MLTELIGKPILNSCNLKKIQKTASFQRRRLIKTIGEPRRLRGARGPPLKIVEKLGYYNYVFRLSFVFCSNLENVN